MALFHRGSHFHLVLELMKNIWYIYKIKAAGGIFNDDAEKFYSGVNGWEFSRLIKIAKSEKVEKEWQYAGYQY